MLQAALFDRNVSMVEDLLELGADADKPVFTGDRPLHVAVGLHDEALVRILSPLVPTRHCHLEMLILISLRRSIKPSFS
jgi:hypothetical protein